MDFRNPPRCHGLLLFIVLSIVTVDSGDVGAKASGDGYSHLTLVIDTVKPLHVTTPSYLSITMSSGQLRRGLEGYDFSSRRMENLAAALGPAGIKIGGTSNDFLNFDPHSDDSNCVKISKKKKDLEASGFTMSGKRWNNITRFCDKVGWEITWGVKLLDPADGPWNPASAREFLEYSALRGVKIPMFELGNEPNLYKRKLGIKVKAKKLAKDYRSLKDLISEIPQYSTSGISAPGVNNLDMFNSPRKYLADFLRDGGCDVINEISLHHYYFKAEDAVLEKFTDLSVMEGFHTQLDLAYSISRSNCRRKLPICVTETSTASGGGVANVSNAFVAGFLWLDKLGLSATYGITRLYRQNLLKSSNALVTVDLNPNPDYYLSVLYKRLVEGPVLRVVTKGLAPEVRIYAHCVGKSHYNYPDGAIVVYYLNVGDDSFPLSLGQFRTDQVDLFLLTPGDELGVLSRKVKLNGNLLEMNGDDLPAMEPKPHLGDVSLASKTLGFIVVPGADVQLCKNYHRSDEDDNNVSC